MKLSIFSTLAMVALASAFPHEKRETTEAQCVKPYLCCGELKTPLDDTVDPILMTLGINAASLVGSIGLDCKFLLLRKVMLDWANNCIGKAYDDSCKSEPQCCTEANLLVCFFNCLWVHWRCANWNRVVLLLSAALRSSPSPSPLKWTMLKKRWTVQIV